MPDTVHTPLGNVKKEYLYVGAGALVIVLGVGYYRSKKASDAAAASASAGANTGIDPATGYAYGSAEDAAALGAQGSYISPSQPYYSGSGGGNYTGGSGQAFTSNAQWSQAAETYMLAADSGADANAIGNALGKYLTGSPVTSDQVSLIQTAIAFEGYPPVTGPTGFPPSINTSGATSGNPTTAPGAISQVNLISWTGQTAFFRWTPATGATSYVYNSPSGRQLESNYPQAYIGGAEGGNISHFPFVFQVQGKNTVGLGPVASAVVTSPGATH
jgi:hypothetical protein